MFCERVNVITCDDEALSREKSAGPRPAPCSLVSRVLSWIRWCLEWDTQCVLELSDYILGARVPSLYCANGIIGELTKDLLSRKYWPTPLLGSSLQSFFAYVRRAPNVQYHRMLVRLKDGGLVGLDWYKWQDCTKRLPPKAPVLLVMHGITGSSQAGYATCLCAAFSEGWRPVAMTYRGCGDLPLEAPMVYSAVDTSDIHAAVLHIQRIFPEAPLLLAGFSLGAMLVTKYLADIESGSLQSAGTKPVAAVALSSLFDIGAAWKRLASASWLDPVYWIQSAVVFRWMLYVRRHEKMLSRIGAFDKKAFFKSTTMVAVDQTLTCKVLGYHEVDEYYRDASSFQYIQHIRTPCLFIVSTDDPFVRDLPIEECRKNQRTVLLVTRHGGHCAHLQGLLPFGRSYIDDCTVIFLKAMLDEKAS
ncbi:Phospholipase ABHD3 [Coccomyxa sp. Obi]|nr:Phospholipase ABHD3 [Coccomyxa sp. Obi]